MFINGSMESLQMVRWMFINSLLDVDKSLDEYL